MQVVIDGCKREYEIDATAEIERIKRLPSMSIKKEVVVNGKVKYVRCDFPKFMKYTKDVPVTQNGTELPYEEIKEGRDKINNRINENLICPMNYLQDWLDKIQGIERKEGTAIKDFFISKSGNQNRKQIAKIHQTIDRYDLFISSAMKNMSSDDTVRLIVDETNKLVDEICKMKLSEATISRLIETALNIDTSSKDNRKYGDTTKSTRKILNLLYRTNKSKFLSNFIEKTPKNSRPN